MVILSVDLDRISFDDVNFDKGDPKTINHARILAWHNKLDKRKAYKKDLGQKINASSVASNTMVGLVLPRRQEKWDINNFY